MIECRECKHWDGKMYWCKVQDYPRLANEMCKDGESMSELHEILNKYLEVKGHNPRNGEQYAGEILELVIMRAITLEAELAQLQAKLLGNTAEEWMGMYHVAADRADKAEAEVIKLRTELYEDLVYLVKEYALESDGNMTQDAIDLKNKLRSLIFTDLQAENAKLRAVAAAAEAAIGDDNTSGIVSYKTDPPSGYMTIPGAAWDKMVQALQALESEGK